MKTVLVESEAEFETLRKPWANLLRRAPSASIFTSWEWMNTWWSIYGFSGELHLLTVLDDSNQLVGIIPLRSQRQSRFGQSVVTLSFVGDGSNDSDYLDAVIAEGCETSVMNAFRAHVERDLEQGAVLLLNEMPAHSPNVPALLNLSSEANTFAAITESPCSTVLLPDKWEKYLSQLRPRFRTKVRSVLRNIDNRPDVQFRFCENLNQVNWLLPILFDLHTRRWRQEGKPGVFGCERKRDFYRALSGVLLDRGWLRFSWLEWNGVVLAAQYGFTYNGVYSQLQEGYAPESEHWNPGIALRTHSIRHFIETGVREYDFLGGIGRHKTDWGSSTKYSKSFVIARRSHKNLIFCYGPQLAAQARKSAKSILPEAIVSIGRKLLSRNSSATSVTPAQQPRLSHVAAHCYFKLQLPAAIRPIRKRYQLRSSGSGRALPWTKRDRASLRILYYHRVNDDQDPFFPSMPTRTFREHMRFIAGHYTVVSLNDAPEHLQTSSSDPLLAITFDDGYEDNYLNAFPILRDYGLPATIFLTTGSIDSREPLWFEQLATALKRTERESLDLEIDTPRRFWLRTEADRLKANSDIFQLLATLSDAGRHDRLKTILHELGGNSCSERQNKMLLWDQVRTMDRQKITFGGHTVTHPFLSKLTPANLIWEVDECKRRIEDELQHPIYHFSYPNGKEQDFGDLGKEAIRRAGYRSAVTTLWGMNYADTDPMELRRGGPWEQDVAEFAYKLDWYQLVND